jgi:hypothetical protein
MLPATAGANVAAAVTAPNTKRASMLNSEPNPAAGDALSLYPLLTIRTMATLKQLGW